MKKEKLDLLFRLILSGLLMVTFGLISYSFAFIFINAVEDKILSIIALVVICIFALFELVVTILKIHHPFGIEKTAFTSRGNINPIPMISMVLIAIIGLGFTIPGLVLFLIKNDAAIKSYSLVILSMGVFILVNCVFYFLYVLSFKKIMKGSH